jgi:hypothetical protein
MALTHKQEVSRLIVQAAGLVLILLCLWEGARPGNLILIPGALVGFFLVLFPGSLMRH